MSPRPQPPSNPFSTRWVRPGALGYRFADGESAGSLVARLAAAGWRGQIVGPHGAGKSTLLAALRPALLAAGRGLLEFQLHDGQRQLPGGFRALRKRIEVARDASLVVIDGHEQLGRWERFYLRRLCLRGCGLLVTAHSEAGLPMLAEVRPNQETVQRLVRELLADYPAETVSREQVAEAYERRGGNVREALFALYDVYEARRGAAREAPSPVVA